MPSTADMDINNSVTTTCASYKTVAFTDRFDKLIRKRGNRGMTRSRAVSIDEARFLARKLRHAVGATADDSALMRVLAHNPEIVRLAERNDGGEPGFVAYLPLRADGLAALTEGRLDRRNPDIALLCHAGETPVALYMWCVYSPGNFIPAIAAIAAHFEEIAPGGVPLFTSAATAPAARLFASLGFQRAIDHFPQADDDVLVVFRSTPEPTGGPGGGPDRGQVAKSPETTTRVSRTIEDVMKVFAIRAATYMHEQACPYDEEFDGNDFCAAHIIGEIGGEPAGCIRIRFFGGFAKLERLAVRPEFRKSSLAFRLVRAAIDYVRQKGFTHIYGHARADLVPFWSRFGFRPISGRPTFSFSAVDYVEMEGAIAPAVNPIGLGHTPYELIRPEGEWDRPGPLDRSARRVITVEAGKRAAA
jgi:predicted GNAT family N-acyltransferase